MTARVMPRSRLRFGLYVTIDDYEFWDLIQYPNVAEQPDDIQHVVQGHDRLDLLAQKYYGDVRCRWVIQVANDIDLEPTQLNPGMTLRIPSPRYVTEQLYQKVRF